MRFLLKVNIMFVLLVVFIFMLAACSSDDAAASSNPSADTSSGIKPVVSGQTDDNSGMTAGDIFGTSSETGTGHEINNSSDTSSDISSVDTPSSGVSSDTPVSSAPVSSGGINYEDPNVWTDPV